MHDEGLLKLAARLDIALPADGAEGFGADGTTRFPVQGYSGNQRKRYSAVLAAARALFSEAGAGHVTVRRLVAQSGVSAPTIYNLVGRRDMVLESALLEQLETCIRVAPLAAHYHDINVIAGFADTLWLFAQTQSSYARRQIQLNWKSLEGRRLAKAFSERTTQAIALWVGDLCGRSRLAKRLEHDNIAGAIEAQLRIAMIDWADGADSLAALRRKLARGASICLLRFVDDKISANIANWLDHLNGEAGPRRSIAGEFWSGRRDSNPTPQD